MVMQKVKNNGAHLKLVMPGDSCIGHGRKQTEKNREGREEEEEEGF